MIYYLDADLHGVDSIADVIAAGKVTHIKCPTYKAFDSAVRELITKHNVGKDDLVIVDTITSLLNTTRDDAKLGTEANTDLFEVGKAKFLGGDKNYMTVYNFAQSIVMRPIKNLAGRDARIIVVAHEDERMDEQTMTRKRLPAVNPALTGLLIGASSDVFRLFNVPEDRTDAQGKVVVKKGTRVLYLRDSDEYIAKYNVPRDKSDSVPKYIVDPTLPKLYETLGKKPRFLTLYGSPGSGKSTFAVSDAVTKGTTK